MLAAIQSEEAPVAVRRGTGLDRLDCDVRIGAVDTRVVIRYHRKIIGPRGQPLNDIGGCCRAGGIDPLAGISLVRFVVNMITRKTGDWASIGVILWVCSGERGCARGGRG